jgi:hypothetical protein
MQEEKMNKQHKKIYEESKRNKINNLHKEKKHRTTKGHFELLIHPSQQDHFNHKVKNSHIQGRRADLDHANRLAYPKERKPARLKGLQWTEPQAQAETVKILKTSGRRKVTPLFVTPVPPKGLSGKMREFGFKFSENDFRHWWILMAADRVHVVEDLISDMRRGVFPKILTKMGKSGRLKYPGKSFLTSSLH